MSIGKLKNKGTLANQAYDTLKESIIKLDLKPGQLIFEETLSDELGISRTPLRAALQRLTYEGFIINSTGKGSIVKELSIKDFIELSEVRESLELLCIKLAAAKRSKEDVQLLKKTMNKQIQITHNNPLNTKEFLKTDSEVHLIIADMAKNIVLKMILIQLKERYDRYLFYTRFTERTTTVVDEHLSIVDAIESGDETKAQNIMKIHLDGVRDSVKETLISNHL